MRGEVPVGGWEGACGGRERWGRKLERRGGGEKEEEEEMERESGRRGVEDEKKGGGGGGWASVSWSVSVCFCLVVEGKKGVSVWWWW